jgi:hypothetical protein
MDSGEAEECVPVIGPDTVIAVLLREVYVSAGGGGR